MKKYLRNTFIISLFAGMLLIAQPVGAAVKPCDTSGAANTEVCKTTAKDLTTGILGDVINILLYVAGTIAVIMIIVGAIRYITSDGDSGRASQARNTIIYAVIGLVVAIMSFGIVNFVIGRL